MAQIDANELVKMLGLGVEYSFEKVIDTLVRDGTIDEKEARKAFEKGKSDGFPINFQTFSGKVYFKPTAAEKYEVVIRVD